MVVAFNFPPFNDGSAVTVAKRIIEVGERVDVISADLSRVRSVDPSLSELVHPLVNSIQHLSVPIKFADETSVRPFVTKGISSLRSRARNPYTSVYSRSMWPHSHFLAAHTRTSGLALEWVAEFSDPILWHADATPRPSSRVTLDNHSAKILRSVGAQGQRLLQERDSILEWAQFVPFLLADELVFTNSQQQEIMIADAPLWARKSIQERSRISPHPTLPRPYYETGPEALPQPSSDGFRIGYFGNFYPNRGGGEFLEALSTLDQDIRRRIHLDVYTSDASPLLKAARSLKLESHVDTRPALPFSAFLRTSDTYDALLVNDIATSPFGIPSPFLPSKYSDYSGSSAPIMAIALEGSPLDIRPAAFKARTGDIDSIRRMLVGAASSS
ncbi:hypothetical protein H3H54_14540 [Brachybacterium sp. Z12]|uniref:hypothetical protein n=1 Tax=Brachybacterium sp. Z12 TaxID=2759167 RepID=UPI00186176E4|nr:hypothetical protein [Brachybacterium sp. Z12]QNN82273.1 hypothetical protein H3H54_14540 [Brachybacterium sp. Z12]